MCTLKTAGQLFLFAVVSPWLVACGKGAKSSAESNGTAIAPGNHYSATNNKPSTTDANAVVINDENVKYVAGSALKAMLLSDISSNSVGNAVDITRNQNSELANLPTGLVIKMQPVNCLYGGNFALQGTLDSVDGAIQIDLAKDLKMMFQTSFNQCNQGVVSMNGTLNISFTAIVNQLVNTNSFTLNSIVSVDQLTIQQAGLTPFVINGSMHYNISTKDGVKMVTEVSGQDMYYAADTSYTVLEFDSYKTENLSTGNYEYTINSRFVDYLVDNSLIEYKTIEPLKGVGFSVPTSGKIAVFGAKDTVTINVLNSESIELSVDYGNDNTTDAIIYSTWYELVLGFLSAR